MPPRSAPSEMNTEHFKKQLEHNRTKYQIVEEAEQPDGSIVIHVKKQYNHYNCDEYLN